MLLMMFQALQAAPSIGVASAASTDDESEVQRLVGLAREGDQAAAGKLYRAYYRQVYRAVRPLCLNDAEAEEVLQESFIKAFGALHRYRPRRGARFVSWLLRIALNAARTQRRRGSKGDVAVEPSELERLGGPAHNVDDDDDELQARQRALVAALSELRPRDREIITLRYGAGLSAQEVGQACGLREANVRKVCQRRRDWLLERVRELMAAQEGEMA